MPISDSVKWPGFDLLAAWNDIFFMALMFLVSGLFVWPGLQQHNAGPYLRRRCCVLAFRLRLAAGVLAPLAYYPAFLQWGGTPRLGSYANAWFALGNWPAGPVWFLWVLLVFDCIAALSFMAIPRTVDAIASRVRALSKRPMLPVPDACHVVVGRLCADVDALRSADLVELGTIRSAGQPRAALLCLLRDGRVPGCVRTEH